MLAMLYESLRGRVLRVGLCFLTFLAVGGAVGLHLSASEAMVARAQQELSREHAFGYDILVRPAGSRSELERSAGLLEANHLNTLGGGISFAQVEAIAALPGVEVAAPIANLGTFRQPLYIWFGEYAGPGVYAVSCRTEEHWGPRTYREESLTYRYVGDDITALRPTDEAAYGLTPGILPPVCTYAFPVSLTAIDPQQEAALVGLQDGVRGTYPTADMAVERNAYQMSTGQQVLYTIPALLQASQHISVTLVSELIPLAWPEGTAGVRDMLGQGGPAALPRQEAIAREVLDGATAYQTLLAGLVGRGGKRFNIPQFSRWGAPAAVTYRPHTPPVTLPLPVYEVAVLGTIGQSGSSDTMPVYRQIEPQPLSFGFIYSFIGTYDPDLLALNADALAPPSLSYAPPQASLKYNAKGGPVAAQEVMPGLEPYGYLLPPPTVLTTLEAARALAGEEAISAVRVRVAGAEVLSAQALERIGAIADQIAAQTGLDVDIVAGAARRPVLLYVPGHTSADGATTVAPLGYVEVDWLAKDAGLAIVATVAGTTARLRGLLTALLAALVVAGLPGLVAGRRPDYALLRAVGWRRGSIVAYALLEGLVIGGGAGLAGLGLALAAASRYALGRLSTQAWLAIPLAALPALLGMLAASLPVARAEVPARAPRRPRMLLLRGWYWWAPSWGTAASFAAALAGTFLVMALQGALANLPARLHGIPLGNYLGVALRGPRDLIVVGALVATLLATAGVRLSSASARRQEAGLLISLGWRRRAVLLHLAAEGPVLAAAGWMPGALLGGTYAMQQYNADLATQVWTAGIVLAGLLLAASLAALYPAFLVSRTSPADTSRPA